MRRLDGANLLRLHRRRVRLRPAAPGVAVVGVGHVQRIAEEVSISRATTTTTGGHCGNVGDAQHPTTGRAHLVVMHGRSGGGCCCSCGRSQCRGHGGATTTGGRLLRRLDEALEAEPLRVGGVLLGVVVVVAVVDTERQVLKDGHHAGLVVVAAKGVRRRVGDAAVRVRLTGVLIVWQGAVVPRGRKQMVSKNKQILLFRLLPSFRRRIVRRSALAHLMTH